MGIFFNNSNGGIMDVIRCDEPDYLVWKWHPEGSDPGYNQRENSIRWGSSLRVKEGSVAVFVHTSDNGTVQDYIEGPADTIIDSDNLPIISSIVGLAYNGKSPFQAEIYFINLAHAVQMKFAVPYFDVYDSELPEFGVPVAVRGSFDFNISDYKDFVRKHRLDSFSIGDLQAQVRDTVSENVKAVIANAPDSYEIPVIHLEKRISDIKTDIDSILYDKLRDDYGIYLIDINLAAIDIDKDSEGYKELKAVTKELTAKTLKKRNKAQNTAEGRMIKGSQAIGMMEKAANKFVDIKESQFVRHKKSEAEFADVIEDKRAGKAGAITGKLIRDIGKISKKNSGDNPPPIPETVKFNVAVNGKATGPYDIDTLKKMTESKQFGRDSLVWKKGMAEWQKAGSVEELNILFSEMPPVPNE